jgi:hypothetical protein
VTLTSALLGPTAAKEQEDEEEEEEAPLHLMVPVDLRKGKESNGFLPYTALVDLGATYNFVSQAVANAVRMRPAKAGRKKKAIATPAMVATVNGEPLRTTSILWYMVRIRNSAGVKRCHVINFIVANVINFDVILGMAQIFAGI